MELASNSSVDIFINVSCVFTIVYLGAACKLA